MTRPPGGEPGLPVDDDDDDHDDGVELDSPRRGRDREPSRGVVVLSRPVSAPHPLPPISLTRMADALGRLPLFVGLGPAQLARLARIAEERLYGAGERIFAVGDPSEGLFLVIEGTVRIVRDLADVGEETLAVLRTGQYFGEMSLIDGEVTRSATATAHHRVRAALLPARELRDLMFVDRDLSHALLWRFVRLLTRRVREANDRLTMLSASAKF